MTLHHRVDRNNATFIGAKLVLFLKKAKIIWNFAEKMRNITFFLSSSGNSYTIG